MTKKLSIMLTVLAAIVLVFAGCEGPTGPAGAPGDGGTAQYLLDLSAPKPGATTYRVYSIGGVIIDAEVAPASLSAANIGFLDDDENLVLVPAGAEIVFTELQFDTDVDDVSTDHTDDIGWQLVSVAPSQFAWQEATDVLTQEAVVMAAAADAADGSEEIASWTVAMPAANVAMVPVTKEITQWSATVADVESNNAVAPVEVVLDIQQPNDITQVPTAPINWAILKAAANNTITFDDGEVDDFVGAGDGTVMTADEEFGDDAANAPGDDAAANIDAASTGGDVTFGTDDVLAGQELDLTIVLTYGVSLEDMINAAALEVGQARFTGGKTGAEIVAALQDAGFTAGADFVAVTFSVDTTAD